MEQNELYPIEEYFMTQNRCYKSNKRRNPTGIQVHSVGCKGTNRDRWRRWNSSAYEKCPNAFIDLNGIMQCLDWDVRPWLSGKGSKGNANDWCVGFEICEPSTKNDTPLAAAYLFGCVKWLCVQLCKEYGIDPSQIKCHSELRKDGVASNHADVTHWWGKKNTSWTAYTMNRLREDVLKELMKDPEYKEKRNSIEFSFLNHATVKKGSSGSEVVLLQTLLNKLNFPCGAADGLFGKKTLAAVKKFQKKYKLKVDGIAGNETWTKLQEVHMQLAA